MRWITFDQAVRSVHAYRLGNPGLTQRFKWSLDLGMIEKEVEAFNVKACQDNNWNDYIMEGEPIASPPIPRPRRPLSSVRSGGAVAAVENAVAGVGLIAEWIGSGLVPVDPQLATGRAAVCVACPLNGDPNFIQKLEGIAAEQVKQLMEARRDMKLNTPLDGALHVCKACDCFLKLKVWSPLELIQKRLKPETLAKLDANCWITAEIANK